MADEAEAPAGPAPVGLLIQPQAVLGRVVIATMQGPLMVAAMVLDDPAQLETIVGQLVAAHSEVWPGPAVPPAAPSGKDRTWKCKLGDDCACARTGSDPSGGVDHNSPCPNYQGEHQ